VKNIVTEKTTFLDASCMCACKPFAIWPMLAVLLITVLSPISTSSANSANSSLQLAQAGLKLDFTESVGRSVDELLQVFQQLNIQYSVKYVPYCDAPTPKLVQKIKPPTGNRTTRFVVEVADRGVIFPELLGEGANKSREILQDAGFLNIAVIGDGTQVTNIEPVRAEECVSTRIPITIDTTIHQSGVEVVNTCEQPETPRIFLRSRDNMINSFGVGLGVEKATVPDAKETLPPHGFILSRIMMLSNESPYYFAVFSSADQTDELLIRSYCRSTNEIVSEYTAISGAFSLPARETAEAVGFQLDDTVILVWQINVDEWMNVYTREPVHDFTLTLGGDDISLFFLSESGDIWHQSLEASEKAKKIWSLKRPSRETDQMISFGDRFLLVSADGWRQFTTFSGEPEDSRISVQLETLRVDRFFTPDGLTDGFAIIRRAIDDSIEGNSVQVVWRDRNGEFNVIDEIELPITGSSDAAVYALPASSDMRRINLIVTYNKNDVGLISCFSAYRPLRKDKWIAVPGKTTIQLDNQIDLGRILKVRLDGEEIVSFANNEFSFGISFRKNRYQGECWS
jgi:hypothetical protein